jgi:hypothetical protein
MSEGIVLVSNGKEFRPAFNKVCAEYFNEFLMEEKKEGKI